MAVDPKRIVGAYLAVHERAMFRVTDVDDDGLVTAENCKTGYLMVLTDATIEESRLVRPSLQGPIADLDAAAEAAVTIPDPDGTDDLPELAPPR